jgi:Dolichyl-phosphate-mannose-protein mannosyltransferase
MMDATRSGADSSGGEKAIPKTERQIGAVLLLIAFGLRCLYITRYRYDSDEPQHLHTTWGWTQGLLHYRDFFDNHTPLFHMLLSPLVALLGERTNILTFMRFAMVPLWIVSLWCVAKMGARLYSRRVGLWAAVLVSLLPWWFFCSVEYRTDNLWTPLWLPALTVLVTGRLSKGRAFCAGLLIGLSFCASMKTSALVASAALAAAAAPMLCARRLDWKEAQRVSVGALFVVAGALVAPAALCAFFAAHGALQALFYGAIQHNLLAGVDAKNHPSYLRLALPLSLPFLFVAACWIGRFSPDRATAVRRAFLFLTATIYYGVLYSVWTLLTRQDFLPFYPVFAVVATPWVLQGVDAAARRFGAEERQAPLRAMALGAIAALEIGLILLGRSPFIDGTRREREILAETLRLTHPGEYVMDFKGEAVFRQRPFFYVLEPLTYVRLRRGLIVDNTAERLVKTQTCVVLNQDRWYPREAAAFMTENYLPVGRMRVAGRIIAPAPAAAGASIPFDVAVPARYVLWADGEPVHGTLDGKPYEGPIDLSAGAHVFQPAEVHRRLAIFWARAAEAGFAPLLDHMEWQDFR